MKNIDKSKTKNGLRCGKRSVCSVLLGSSCYQVQENEGDGSAGQRAGEIIRHWCSVSNRKSIPVILNGAGWWVAKEIIRMGFSVDGIQVNSGGLKVIAVFGSYHVVDVSDCAKEFDIWPVCHAVAYAECCERGIGFDAHNGRGGINLRGGCERLMKSCHFQFVCGFIVHDIVRKLLSPNVKLTGGE